MVVDPFSVNAYTLYNIWVQVYSFASKYSVVLALYVEKTIPFLSELSWHQLILFYLFIFLLLFFPTNFNLEFSIEFLFSCYTYGHSFKFLECTLFLCLKFSI